jgi:hypothetical protein
MIEVTSPLAPKLLEASRPEPAPLLEQLTTLPLENVVPPAQHAGLQECIRKPESRLGQS